MELNCQTKLVYDVSFHLEKKFKNAQKYIYGYLWKSWARRKQEFGLEIYSNLDKHDGVSCGEKTDSSFLKDSGEKCKA